MVKFIKECAKIEETAALIYHEFSRNKHCDAELVKIWQDMARDEEDHALQLKFALRVPLGEAFSGVRNNCPDPEKLYALASGILQKTRENGCQLLEMLKDAVTLEKEFCKIHATYALEFKEPGLLKTFKALANADAEHLQALQNYLKRYKEEHRP